MNEFASSRLESPWSTKNIGKAPFDILSHGNLGLRHRSCGSIQFLVAYTLFFIGLPIFS
jgi:hypothetical protein